MNNAFHGYATSGHGRRNRVHQKGHVVVVQRNAHHQTALRIGKTIQCYSGGARLAVKASLDREPRRILGRFGIKAFILAR